VDIECIREDWPRCEAIAERHFAPGEIQQLKALPESARTRGFFDLWTRKEAFVKARGVGLFSGLSQFETSLVCENGVRVNEVRADDWWMAALPELPGCAGSVAVNATRCEPRFWKWK
jgi:4'-phosphopantetheinyl transferase